MTYAQAMLILTKGGKIRRPSWQPGWLEFGTFQGKPAIFYHNPTSTNIAGYEMPAFKVTYNQGHDDRHCRDWEQVSHKESSSR